MTVKKLLTAILALAIVSSTTASAAGAAALPKTSPTTQGGPVNWGN